MDLRHRLLEALEPFLAGDLVELVDLEVLVTGRRRTVRLFVDQPGGVTIDDCARISRRVEDILDAKDLVPFGYVLEVSSPGLDRPLRKPQDFERFVGERVEVRMSEDFGTRRRFTGTLSGLVPGAVRVVVDGGDEVDLPLEQVARARLRVDPWKPKGVTR